MNNNRIDRVRFGRARALAGAALVGVMLLAAGCSGKNEHPNLLLITMDTTRADRIGCYGCSHAVTPALDGLARLGVVFDRAYTCVPITLPAHASIMTGLYPPEHGLRTNGKNALGRDIPTLAEILLRENYLNGAFIAASVLAPVYGLNRGFDVYDAGSNTVSALANPMLADQQNLPYRRGDEVADAALRWLGSLPPGQRFFCWVHFYDPHPPLHMYPELFRDSLTNAYDAEVAFMDRQIGRLRQFLVNRRLDTRTIVVAVADHGEGLGDHGEESHGFFLYNTTLRVPMIIAWPGKVRHGVRNGGTVGSVDLLPTLLDLMGITPPEGRRDEYARRSFAKACHGMPLPTREYYAETILPYLNFGWSPLFSLVNPSWKYIRAPARELYDLLTDPGERINLASGSPATAAEMDDRISVLQRQMLPGAAKGIRLSDAQRRQLASLGYVAGTQFDELPDEKKELADPKDMKEIIELQSAVLTRLQAGDTGDKVLAMCRQIIAASPGTAMFHEWLGLILAGQGNLGAARQAFQEALKMAPNEVTAHNNYGLALARQGEFAEAIERFSEARRLNPIDESVQQNLATACNQYGMKLGQAGDYTGAVKYLSLAVEARPGMAEAHQNLGSALMGLRRYDEAIRQLEEALRIRPDYPTAFRNLETARRLAGRDEGQ